MPEEKGEFLQTRRSLLGRLKDWDDQESWRDFFNSYWRLIYNTAIKSGLSDVEAQEVVQETVVSVAKKIKEFEYDPARGSFKGWLLQLTRWRVTDQLRKRKPGDAAARGSSNDPTRTDTIHRLPDPNAADLDAIWDEEWERNLVDMAVERVKSQVTAKQYQIFDCYVIKQWPAEKVAETLQVSMTQVYLAKHRVGGLMKKEIQRLEREGAKGAGS